MWYMSETVCSWYGYKWNCLQLVWLWVKLCAACVVMSETVCSWCVMSKTECNWFCYGWPICGRCDMSDFGAAERFMSELFAAGVVMSETVCSWFSYGWTMCGRCWHEWLLCSWCGLWVNWVQLVWLWLKLCAAGVVMSETECSWCSYEWNCVQLVWLWVKLCAAGVVMSETVCSWGGYEWRSGEQWTRRLNTKKSYAKSLVASGAEFPAVGCTYTWILHHCQTKITPAFSPK